MTDGALGRTLLRAVCHTERIWCLGEEALNATKCLPVIEELDCELLELKEVLGSLAPGKAPRKDIIPSEILKC